MKRVTLAALLLPAAIAIAQEEPPPLSGPPVTEERLPGVESGFSSMMAADRARMSEPVPMNVFRRAVMELGGEDAGPDIRLSDEQTQRLRAIERAHRESIAAFRREHAEEIERIREDLGPRLAARLGDLRSGRPDRTDRTDRTERPQADEPGAPPDMQRDAPQRPAQRPIQREDLTETQRNALAAATKLRAEAPGDQALQTKIWAELTEPQQAHVQSRIDAFRAEAAERRQEAYAERIMAQRQARTDRPITDQPDARADPDQLAPELREVFQSLPERMRGRLIMLPQERLERVLTRFASLTPEQRQQALQRLRERGAQDPPRRPPPDPAN